MNKNTDQKIDASFRSSELRTLAILGYRLEILQLEPCLKVVVFVKSSNYDRVTSSDPRAGCSLVFICPRRNPLRAPKVRFGGKCNIPDFLEGFMMTEFRQLRNSGRGSLHILLMVVKARALVEQMARRLKKELQDFREDEEFCTTL